MRIRLVSHASVITRGRDASLWCDPWLFGKAFNDSWSLFPPAAWDERWLSQIGYLWISHEHPDHLHFPTLRSLPDAWKREVTVLYQSRAADEVVGALRRLGFGRIRTLPHRKKVRLTDDMSVYCYHALYGDSCLAIQCGDEVALNVNDAQVDENDCATIRADLGRVDVLLKQFSLAGYTGGPDWDASLRQMAGSILLHMENVHRWVGAKVTLPFASFVYFSSTENQFVNRYVNRPTEVHRHLVEAGCDVALLFPGDEYDTEAPFDSRPRLEKFAAIEPEIENLPVDTPPVVPLSELQEAFREFAADVHDKFTRSRIDVLPPVRIRVPDLDATLEMSIPARTLEAVGPLDLPAHLQAGSRALHFAFRGGRYGFETMTISSRALILDDVDWPWILNRDLLWLYRWRIWLAPKWLLSSPANLRRVWPWARERDLNLSGVVRLARRAPRRLLRRAVRFIASRSRLRAG